ncbi:universal stress protein [Amycolatopsis cihanbeyliensis]|uniref:Nucleotide-binding universal stress UspA family protein n=1 Tax=Amycolatopsis cihanbeyliensis TaxID=1128664 RepID=A0A542DE27_AMYCI|nr:universal stress protein [Amycolatopsis cihanbeyliensis]TQJ01322.1 nucleotide-binding universal stress UspA family protein [Amycolatopsis cihanbeyliensis]
MSQDKAAGGEIVVGVDGSAGTKRAVRWAAQTAAERGLGLRVVHAVAVTGGYYGNGLAVPLDFFGALEQDGERILTGAAEAAREAGASREVGTSLVRDPVIPALIELSREARMIVLGESGRGGFAGMRLGSTAVAVTSHAHCPVVVVRGRDGEDVPADGPVVVGVDGSQASERAVAVAFEEASLRGAPLVAVHSWLDGDYDTVFSPARFNSTWESVDEVERRALAERLAGWQEKYPDVQVERVVARDRPRHQLLEWSARARLLVVGCRGRGGFRGMLLGSTSQALLQHAECPVLVVRPEPAG